MKKGIALLLMVALLISSFVPAAFAEPSYDVIIKNGLVIDGSGAGGIKTDIGIIGDRIAKIGSLSSASAKKVIDATDRIVAPGFIDIHTHADRGILKIPSADNYIMQGVTTLLGGNCGGSEAKVDVAEYLGGLGKIGINFGTLVGFGDLRNAAMADPTAKLTDKELKAMTEYMKQGMKDGAFGISTGLEYIPDRFATTEEIVEVAKVAAAYGGFYATHSRDEQTGVLTSVAEAIEIGARAKIPVEISHLKACGAEVWGYGKTMIAMINVARALGVDVAADMYPYGASSTGFSQAFPSWSVEGGMDKLKERLADPAIAARIRAYAANQIRIRVGEDFSLIQIASYSPNPAYEGKTMADILTERGKELTMDNMLDLVIEMYTSGNGPSIIYHYINEDDIKTIMRSPYVSIASDGDIRVYGEGVPHPRNYGTFPRVLSRYVNEQYVISPEEAIRKMTSLPAAKMKIMDRGLIKEGYYADIVIYDEANIKDTADFFNPHQYPQGIDYVLVNGCVAVDHGQLINGTSGQVLYGPGYSKR